MKKMMNQLRAEARAVLAAYTPDGDFNETIDKLAAIGYRMEGLGKAA